MNTNLVFGNWGETVATQYLVRNSYTILERNWKHSSGEIDVIAHSAGWAVFVEVKSRSSLDFGHPFESINQQKLTRIYRLALEWCQQNSISTTRIRIDAIAIIGTIRDGFVIEHLKGVY